MKKTTMVLLGALAAIALAALPASGDEKKGESKMQKTPSGLQYEDVKVGTGAQPKTGQTCVVQATTNWTTWLPVFTNTSTTAPLNFLDTHSPAYPRRFYRAVLGP